MIKVLTLFCVLLVLSSCDTIVLKKIEPYEPLDFSEPPRLDSKVDDKVGWACYYAGSATQSVKRIGNLLKKSDFTQLKKALQSNYTGDRFLATYSCLYLQKKGKLTLTPEEQNQIVLNKLSSEQVTFCSGCTESDTYTFVNLFSIRTPWHELLDKWIIDTTVCAIK